MSGGDGGDGRPNVRWDTDFGPAAPMWRRYLLAALLVALVLGFLAVAIFLLGDAPGARVAADPWLIPALLGLAVVFTVVSVFGERWAVALRRRLEGRRGPSDDSVK